MVLTTCDDCTVYCICCVWLKCTVLRFIVVNFKGMWHLKRVHKLLFLRNYVQHFSAVSCRFGCKSYLSGLRLVTPSSALSAQLQIYTRSHRPFSSQRFFHQCFLAFLNRQPQRFLKNCASVLCRYGGTRRVFLHFSLTAARRLKCPAEDRRSQTNHRACFSNDWSMLPQWR